MRTEPEDTQSPRALFVLHVLAVEGSACVEAAIEHRNRVDTGWSGVGSFMRTDSPCIQTLEISDLKEQVRWELNVADGSAEVQRDIVWRPSARDHQM